jgi:hypothetical protein
MVVRLSVGLFVLLALGACGPKRAVAVSPPSNMGWGHYWQDSEVDQALCPSACASALEAGETVRRCRAAKVDGELAVRLGVVDSASYGVEALVCEID